MSMVVIVELFALTFVSITPSHLKMEEIIASFENYIKIIQIKNLINDQHGFFEVMSDAQIGKNIFKVRVDH